MLEQQTMTMTNERTTKRDRKTTEPSTPERRNPIGASRAKLARDIREFLSRTGMKPTPFGLAAGNDDKLLWRIEHAPNGISLDKADRIRQFMRNYDLRFAGTGVHGHIGRAKNPGDNPGARPRLEKDDDARAEA